MRQSYSKSFKAETVKLALGTDCPISKTAEDLGIKVSLLYNWIHEAKKNGMTIEDASGKSINLTDELMRLRKENIRLKQERDILKKAAAFFAQETE